MDPEQIFPIFVGVWVVLGIFSYGVFFVGKNAALKRKYWPPFVIVTGALFIAFAYSMGFGGSSLYVMVPAVALISFLNIRNTRFCDACGQTVVSQNFLVKQEFCSKCGANLS